MLSVASERCSTQDEADAEERVEGVEEASVASREADRRRKSSSMVREEEERNEQSS